MASRWRSLVLVAGTLLVLLSGCATTDVLADYRFRGGDLACRMRTPPEPEVFTHIDLHVERSDPLGSVIRVGTSLAKAAEAWRASERMERALDAVDVPEEIRRSTLEEVAVVLACDPVERTSRADYILDLEIREYGIDAASWSSPAEFRVDMRVSLRDGFDGREIWRARIREEEPVSPAFFGLNSAVDSIVTAVVLSELSERDIARGLMRLATAVANRVADRLDRDLSRARSS